MTAEHLSDNQLVGYGAKSLNSEELLAVDRHLASCEACHDRLTRLSPIERSYDLSIDEPFHLDYDQHVVPYVDCAADEIDREIIESHIALCSQCAEDIRDLQHFRQQTVPSPVAREVPRLGQARQKWRWPQVWAPPLTATVAIAIFLLGITAAVMLWAINSTKPVVHQAGPAASPQEQLPGLSSPGPSPDEVVKQPSPGPSSPTRNERVVALNDGGRQITIDERGQSTGLESLPPDLRRSVENVLAARKFSRSPALGDLSEGTGRLRSGSDEMAMLVQVSPGGVVVESDRPVLRWHALQGASDYVVTVFDSNFRVIENSGPLTGTEWTPQQPLRRGVTYSWQIRTIVDGKTVISPKPPAPEMRFRILDQAAFAAIENARRTYPNSHLAMAVLYWKHGLLSDADRELEALARANPNSNVTSELLRSLRALWRQ